MTKLSMEGEEHQIAASVPLFLRKLWKMVNDPEAEDIIGWNRTGDGFLIYDQLEFIVKLLPKYFKHNNMASFIRQLNFYDFHKVAGLDKDEIQFSHGCFLKDLPETLVFIKRKCTSLRSKLADNVKEEELSDILTGVKELKNKHSKVDNDLKQLKQENAALWSEVNSLRVKHAKQTKIINKIIHFLISYIHSHQTPMSKGKPVGRRDSQNLKTGPTILEIGYHDSPDYVEENVYTDTAPGHSGAITYPSNEYEGFPNMQPAERTLDEILNKVGVGASIGEQMECKPTILQADVKPDIKPDISDSNLGLGFFKGTKGKPSEVAKTSVGSYNPPFRNKQEPGQKPVKYNILENPKEHLVEYLDNTQVELNSLQDILNNLSSDELANFCTLIENTETDDSKEDVMTNPYSEADAETLVNDQYLRESLAEELANLPQVESNTINEINFPNNLENVQDPTEQSQNIEVEVLPDEYFTI